MTLADRVHRALLDQLHTRAMHLGASVAEEALAAPVRLSVSQVEAHAAGRQVDGLAEHQADVEDARRWLDADDGERDLSAELAQLLRVSLGRSSIASSQPVPHGYLAALAGMSDRHLTRLVRAGDAPTPREEPSAGRVTTYEPGEVATWLRGRGVEGL